MPLQLLTASRLRVNGARALSDRLDKFSDTGAMYRSVTVEYRQGIIMTDTEKITFR